MNEHNAETTTKANAAHSASPCCPDRRRWTLLRWQWARDPGVAIGRCGRSGPPSCAGSRPGSNGSSAICCKMSRDKRSRLTRIEWRHNRMEPHNAATAPKLWCLLFWPPSGVFLAPFKNDLFETLQEFSFWAPPGIFFLGTSWNFLSGHLLESFFWSLSSIFNGKLWLSNKKRHPAPNDERTREQPRRAVHCLDPQPGLWGRSWSQKLLVI